MLHDYEKKYKSGKHFMNHYRDDRILFQSLNYFPVNVVHIRTMDSEYGHCDTFHSTG